MTMGARAILLAAAIAVQLVAPGPALAACRFVMGGSNLTLTVVLVGVDNGSLTVDWGDGASSYELEERPGRVRASHDYPAPGDYEIAIRDGSGCSARLGFSMPQESRGSRPDAEAILAGWDPPQRPILVDFQERRNRGIVESVGELLGSLLGGLFGRRLSGG